MALRQQIADSGPVRRTVAAISAACAIMLPFRRASAELPLPATLSGTGFFQVEKVSFAPQYPLWSDGADKRRWIHLPPGTSIDASNPDEWNFPVGTRLWKQFGYGRPLETRFIEHLPDRTWRYAVYIWNESGTEATLAPEEGVGRMAAQGAPDGWYAILSRKDCPACHEGPSVPVLGFTALQLSGDRDPLAPHADPAGRLELRGLVERGWLRNLPARLIESPPKIAAGDANERAVLGYLHGNCGHCHNDGALPGVDLMLAHGTDRPRENTERALASLVGHRSRFRAHGAQAGQRVVPGSPGASVILQRMRSPNPMARMPPLGVRVEDKQATGLIERWIRNIKQLKEK